MISRRDFNRVVLGGLGVAALAPSSLAATKQYQPVLREDGHYTQSWFLDSFLELADDIEEARSKRKRFAIMWDQDGCPYCRETHLVNFTIPEIRDFVEANFEIVQLNIWGAREVVDFDGSTITEKQLAKRNKIRFTPTVQFYPETVEELKGKTGKAAESDRMPGYFRPFHFLTMFEYVRANGHKQGDFRSFLKNKVATLKAEGKSLPDW
ncbi:MAG: thioredoxin family protein [Rhodospirillales bacterium]|nr:thioredoxin family protein [Rhodospirillales bacterium]